MWKVVWRVYSLLLLEHQCRYTVCADWVWTNTLTLSESARPNSSNGGFKAQKTGLHLLSNSLKVGARTNRSKWTPRGQTRFVKAWSQLWALAHGFLKLQHVSKDWLSLKCLPKPQGARQNHLAKLLLLAPLLAVRNISKTIRVNVFRLGKAFFSLVS